MNVVGGQDVEAAMELLETEDDKNILRDAVDEYNNTFILKWVLWLDSDSG